MIAKVSDTDDLIAFKIISRFSNLLQLSAISVLVYRWYKSLMIPGAKASIRSAKVRTCTNYLWNVATLD